MAEPPPQAVTEGGGFAKKAAVGVAWTTAQKWVTKLTGFLTIAILARLLSPADFGLVAAATALLALMQLFADLGFSTYVLQAKRLTRKTLDTYFWYVVTAGIVLAGILVLSGPALGWMLNSPEVAPVVAGFAPVAIAIALGAVPTTVLKRNLKFRALATQGAIAGLIGQVVAIALALTGFGVWALVAQSLVVQIVASGCAWYSARWRPKLSFSVSEFRQMVRFGVKVITVEFVAMSRMWLENAIIVAALGVAGLGYLSIAQRLVATAQDLTSSALAPVSLIVFAQIRENVDRLRSGYLRAQSVSYAVIGPTMVFLAVGSPMLIPIIFGDQWEVSIGPAQALAVAGIFVVGASLDHGLFYGLGKPGAWLAYAIAVDAATVLVTFCIAPRGLLAITVAFIGVAALATMVRWVLVGRQLQAAWWQIAVPFARTCLPAAGAGAVALGLSQLVQDVNPWLALVIQGLTLVLVYLPVLRLTAPAIWLDLADLLRSAVARVRSGRKAGQ